VIRHADHHAAQHIQTTSGNVENVKRAGENSGGSMICKEGPSEEASFLLLLDPFPSFTCFSFSILLIHPYFLSVLTLSLSPYPSCPFPPLPVLVYPRLKQDPNSAVGLEECCKLS